MRATLTLHPLTAHMSLQPGSAHLFQRHGEFKDSSKFKTFGMVPKVIFKTIAAFCSCLRAWRTSRCARLRGTSDKEGGGVATLFLKTRPSFPEKMYSTRTRTQI